MPSPSYFAHFYFLPLLNTLHHNQNTGPDIVINLKTQNFCLVVGFSNGILQLGIYTKLPKLMLIPLIQLLYCWHCE